MNTNEKYSFLTKENVRDLMLEALYFSCGVEKEKVLVSESLTERVQGLAESWFNGKYMVYLPDINAINFEEDPFGVLIDLVVDAMHEGTHVKQKELYPRSLDPTEQEIHLDSVTNGLWKHLKEENYPNQLYEIDARKQSFKLAFKFLTEKLARTEEDRHEIAKALFKNFYLYETGKKLSTEREERLNLSSCEQILKVIDDWFTKEFDKHRETLYEYPKNHKIFPEARIVVGKEFANKKEQNMALFKSFADLEKYPYKEYLVKDLVKDSPGLRKEIGLEKEPEVSSSRFG